jgi:hypothetical protein
LAAWNEPRARNEPADRHARSSHLGFFFGFEKEGLLIESFEFRFVVHDSTHFSASRLLIKHR